MRSYNVEKIKNIYENTSLKDTLEITDTVSFSIPVKDTNRINYIDLFFSTNKKECNGKLTVVLSLGEDDFKYVLPLNSIKDKTPFRFNINKVLFKKVKTVGIFLNVSYESSDLLAIYVNSAGFCSVISTIEQENIALKHTPLISIITPVYKPSLDCFKQAYESVLAQLYQEWEWCLVDDGSNSKKISTFLKSIKSEKL